LTEWADVETSSEDYARRFRGATGRWFLERQTRLALELLAPFPGARILDVGGGHGQLAAPLADARFGVTVLGSTEACDERIRPLVESGRVSFRVGELLPLPFDDASFDVVLAFRLLPHVELWGELIGEMRRVARRAVVFDYPTRRSVNAIAGALFRAKKSVEGNTRPFTVFTEGEIAAAVRGAGARETGRRPEFSLPMALHRALGVAPLSRVAEWTMAALGVTRLLGSPVILRIEPGVEEPWPLALFRRSVLKQAKVRELAGALGTTAGRRCLDLGSDNGVVSLLLRRRGGSWASADMTEEAVESIRELVKEDVHRTDAGSLPFRDAEFDTVAVVDMLEHAPDEARFVAELARVTRPGGRLVINTPHLKRTALRRLRHLIGQTDEKHGHLRPGYTPERLEALLGGAFRLESHRTYSRFFSELVDAALNFAVERLGKKGSAKGVVVTGSDVRRHRKLFRAYSVVYPFVWAVSRLDGLVPFASGYMLVAVARRTGPGSDAV
jgi:2-polyprenyl-3-methyl-5-hydroxy-6-metoxy-1,4-benzoquinol methylase